MRINKFWLGLIGALVLSMAQATAVHAEENGKKKLVIVAGKPSHPKRMHEFNAGSKLLVDCLKGVEGVTAHVVTNGWPKDEAIFDNADAVIFYMDGGKGHEVVQEGERRLTLVDGWAKRGVGLGFMHYGVEVVPDQAGKQFKSWMAGHYEHMFSCNPIWEPMFTEFPEHPITRGVKPFKANDEWYINMRFLNDVPGNQPGMLGDMKFTPILVAAPSDAVRNGPYVYPKGPYSHIQANMGRAEAMMWAVERTDGGRGFGFTGGHFHDNWSNDDFRKVVLNACVWLTKAEVPASGIESKLTPGQIDENLDPKAK